MALQHLPPVTINDDALDVADDSPSHHLTADAWCRLEVRDATPRQVPSIWPAVQHIIATSLTEPQRQVLELYFVRGLDQYTIAELLGITQQSVSEHLFGKTRGGRQVGGLIRKLRKCCAAAGISPRGMARLEG